MRRGADGSFSTIQLPPSAKIYIMGVCGTAMSALAGLLVQKGYHVFGSDHACYSPAREELQRLHVNVLSDYRVSYIDDVDLVVVGNVVAKKWPVAKALLQSGQPYLHLPEALNAFVISDRNKCIMVTGTHGKTTVSCLLAWVLDQCGLNPSFMIGGVAENFHSNFLFNESDWFVVEGDEYDTAFFEKTPKFLHYPASHIILTNAEFDHADIYNNPEEVRDIFRQLIKQKTEESLFVMGCGSLWMSELIKMAGNKALTYGMHKGDYQIIRRRVIIQNNQFIGQAVSVKEPNGQIVDMEIPLAGEHNALNFLSVWALTRLLKLDSDKIGKAFKSFKGTRRRLQILGEFNGILLIEDFAHHPTAVRAVIQSVQEMYPHRRVLALFEPRSNTSRRNIFQQEYQKSLSLADVVFCMEAYNPTNIPQSDRFSAQSLVCALKDQGKLAFSATTVQEMTHIVQQNVQIGDVVLAMSNGDFGGIYSLLKNALSSK